MAFRDDMEAARHRIEAMEVEIRHLLPESERGDGPVEAEVIRLRRQLSRTELQLEKEFQRRSIAERAERELERARNELRWRERVGQRMRSELARRESDFERARRRAALASERELEARNLRERLEQVEARAQEAERETGRLRVLLALERARGDVPSLLRVPLSEVRERLAMLFDRERWPDVEDTELLAAMRELAVIMGEAVWARLDEPPFETFSQLLELLREAGHPLDTDDGCEWGCPPTDLVTLIVRITPFRLHLEVRRPHARRLLVELSGGGLRAVIRA